MVLLLIFHFFVLLLIWMKEGNSLKIISQITSKIVMKLFYLQMFRETADKPSLHKAREWNVVQRRGVYQWYPKFCAAMGGDRWDWEQFHQQGRKPLSVKSPDWKSKFRNKSSSFPLFNSKRADSCTGRFICHKWLLGTCLGREQVWQTSFYTAELKEGKLKYA